MSSESIALSGTVARRPLLLPWTDARQPKKLQGGNPHLNAAEVWHNHERDPNAVHYLRALRAGAARYCLCSKRSGASLNCRSPDSFFQSQAGTSGSGEPWPLGVLLSKCGLSLAL